MVLDETHMGLNYQEDSALSNLKLVVGFAGVGASLVSHVYPAPFPKNWFVLLLCCASQRCLLTVVRAPLKKGNGNGALAIGAPGDSPSLARGRGIDHRA